MAPRASEISERLGAVLDAYVSTRTEPAMLLPANDYFDLAGEEFGRRLLLTTGADGADYCLRPDFTLPIAQSFIASRERGAKAYGYWGKAFRQRADGPAEFTQMGLELLDQPNGDAALDTVLGFVLDATNAAELSDLSLTFGSVAMFETVLAGANIPEVWLPRLRHRFGQPQALNALLDRLEAQSDNPQQVAFDRENLINSITEKMLDDGLSLNEGRTPTEIADRYIEKQQLAAARVAPDVLDFLRQFLAISGPVETAMNNALDLCNSQDIDISNAMIALDTHRSKLAETAPQISQTFATGFAPRLHYYTGLVFELHDRKNNILASGGQYDRLLKSLGADDDISAAGVAIWIERLLEAQNG